MEDRKLSLPVTAVIIGLGSLAGWWVVYECINLIISWW